MSNVHEIPERSGTAFRLAAGELLTVIDPRGGQVADLLAFNGADPDEVISSGRTLDYAETIYLTTGHVLYSNRSRPMLAIVEDMVGRHDFLLTPCSVDTFRHFYPDEPSIGVASAISRTRSRRTASCPIASRSRSTAS